MFTGKWMDSETPMLDALDGFKAFALIPNIARTILRAIKAGALISQQAASWTSSIQLEMGEDLHFSGSVYCALQINKSQPKETPGSMPRK